MLTPSNSSRTVPALSPVTTEIAPSDLTAQAQSDEQFPALPHHKSNLSLSDIAEAVLRDKSGILEPISITPAHTSNLTAEQLSLICNPSPTNTWVGYVEYGDTKSYLGVQLSGSYTVDVVQVIDNTIVSSTRTSLEAIQSSVACLPYYRMPVRELIDTYLTRVDSLLGKYSHHLVDFDSPLTSLRRTTTLQKHYNEHCKVSWIVSSYSAEEEDIVPDDIQEIIDIERILIARRDDVFSTTNVAERNCLHRATAQVRKEVIEFLFSDADSHPIIRFGSKGVSNLLNGVVTWLVKNTPFSDAPLQQSLQVADTPFFFNRFATLYLILSVARGR